MKYEYLNNEILNWTRSLSKPQARYFDLASKCEVIKMYSGLSVLLVINVILGVMPLAHYYDVDRELHELQHRGELVPTRNEIMGKIGASILLSYPCLVVSYAAREGALRSRTS